MLESAVDGFGWAVAGAGPVEVGQYVGGAALEGPAERDELGQRSGDACAEGVDERAHRGASVTPVGVAVGGDHLLVDAKGRLDLHVRVDREQPGEPGVLLVGEQVGAGVRVRRAE